MEIAPHQHQLLITLIRHIRKSKGGLEGHVIDTGIPVAGDLLQLKGNIKVELLWQAYCRRKGNTAITARQRCAVRVEIKRESEEG